MNVLLPPSPRSLLYPKGLILWRSCQFTATKAYMPDFRLEPTEKKSVIARCRLNGMFIHEPEVIPNKIEGNSKNFIGTVVFIDREPKPGWTHLIVTSTSKKMSKNPLENPKGLGCAIFATPGKPFDGYLDFRHRMYRWHIENLSATYEEKLQATLNIQPIDTVPGDMRLVYDPFGHSRVDSEKDAFYLPGYNFVTTVEADENREHIEIEDGSANRDPALV